MLFLACKERDIYERDRLGVVKPKLWQVSFPAGLQAERAGGDACEEGGGPARLAGVGAGVTQRCQLFKWSYLNGLGQCQHIQAAAAVCLRFLLLLTQ